MVHGESFSTERRWERVLRRHLPNRWQRLLPPVTLPTLPVDDIQIRLSLPHPIREVRPLPSGGVLRFRSAQGVVTFTAPRLRTLAMMALTYA